MSQFNQNLLPPAVADLISTLRGDRKDNLNTRENVAARLATIVEVCDAELKRYRSNQLKGPVRKKSSRKDS